MGKPYNFDQASFRGRDDSQTLNSSTFTYALNTDWNQDEDTVFRCRYLIQETAGGDTGVHNVTVICQLALEVKADQLRGDKILDQMCVDFALVRSVLDEEAVEEADPAVEQLGLFS